MINIELRAAKRTAEILQEKDQAINNLNISAALRQTAREFTKRGINNEQRILHGCNK